MNRAKLIDWYDDIFPDGQELHYTMPEPELKPVKPFTRITPFSFKEEIDQMIEEDLNRYRVSLMRQELIGLLVYRRMNQ